VSVRLRVLLVLLVLVPAGLATKIYGGPGLPWVRGHLGGLLYVVFWILVLVAIRPSLPLARVGLAVFAVTCGIEVLQLWHPPLLEAARGTALGRTLLGNTFSAWDFPHYAAGAVLGVLLARRLARPQG